MLRLPLRRLPSLQGVDKVNNLYQHRFLPKLYKSYHSAFPGAGDCSKKLPAVKGCPSTSAQRTAPWQLAVFLHSSTYPGKGRGASRAWHISNCNPTCSQETCHRKKFLTTCHIWSFLGMSYCKFQFYMFIGTCHRKKFLTTCHLWGFSGMSY